MTAEQWNKVAAWAFGISAAGWAIALLAMIYGLIFG